MNCCALMSLPLVNTLPVFFCGGQPQSDVSQPFGGPASSDFPDARRKSACEWHDSCKTRRECASGLAAS